MKCEDCKFSALVDAGGWTRKIECRRNPPSIGGFPTVTSDTWCGEFKKKTTEMSVPTVEEIGAYCAERNNGIDPGQFFAFYESKDWKVGRLKMKDWKAAIRTWEAKDAQRQRTGNQTAAERNAALDDHLSRRMRDG